MQIKKNVTCTRFPSTSDVRCIRHMRDLCGKQDTVGMSFSLKKFEVDAGHCSAWVSLH